MTPDELVKQVLQGILVLVGEYRASHAEMAGYVNKKSGEAIRHVRAIHLVECVWYDQVDRVLLMQYFGDNVATVEQATATFTLQTWPQVRFLSAGIQMGARSINWSSCWLGSRTARHSRRGGWLAARRSPALLTLFN